MHNKMALYLSLLNYFMKGQNAKHFITLKSTACRILNRVEILLNYKHLKKCPTLDSRILDVRSFAGTKCLPKKLYFCYFIYHTLIIK